MDAYFSARKRPLKTRYASRRLGVGRANWESQGRRQARSNGKLGRAYLGSVGESAASIAVFTMVLDFK